MLNNEETQEVNNNSTIINNERIQELHSDYLMKKAAILKYLKIILNHPATKDADIEDIYECLEKVVSIRSSQMEGSVISQTKSLTVNEIIENAINETFVSYTIEPLEYIEEDLVNLIDEPHQITDELPFVFKPKEK